MCYCVNLRHLNGDLERKNKLCYVPINQTNAKERKFMASVKECKPRTDAMFFRHAVVAAEKSLAHNKED